MKFNDREYMIELTPEWKGERFPDGRPKVSDDILRRIRDIKTEEAWMPLADMGYKLQFEGDLKMLHPGKKLIGRAVTAVMVPSRPDVHMALINYGRNVEKRKGYFNQWVVDSLQENDVLVVDMCDQILYGTYVGGNLSTSIKTRTKNGGAVIWGGVRDLEQITEIEDFQLYYRGVHPSPIGDVMMTGMNVPCKIGKAICMPGDVVLGTMSGIVFIPAHLAESVCIRAEKSKVRDIFGFKCLQDKTYTTAQIDQTWWHKELMLNFLEWFKTAPEAAEYQYLDWSEELEKADSPSEIKPFNGFVGYSYY